MKIVYTKHALEKLRRPDIKKFGIKKKTIINALKKSEFASTTKYGDYAIVSNLDISHDLRVIYVIIDVGIKVITFHVARKGRYQ